MDPVSIVLLAVLVVGAIAAFTWWRRSRQEREARRLADARADAQRWYDRLGGQVMNLSGNEDQAVKQALTDAGERYNAAGSQLAAATTTRQYELAGETAVEGLYYVRAAREGLGMDPGPDLPLTEAQRRNGVVMREREVSVAGDQLKASPRYAPDAPYYYPGGQMQGRQVPAGYYSQPFWRTALASGAGVLGGMLLFDALFAGDLGYDSGFADGAEAYDGDGSGDAGDAGGGFDGGGFDGGGFDGGGFDGGF